MTVIASAKVKGQPLMADVHDPGGAAALAKLAAQLDSQIYAARLVAVRGLRPHLHITNRHATMLRENIYSDGEHFYWGWAQRIGPIADLAAAAAAVDRVLHVLGGKR